jgi:hypothetical protein
VKVNGGKDRRPTYTCAAGQHVRRDAARLDELIEGALVAAIVRDSGGTMLRPAPAPHIDTARLRRQLRDLDARRDDARRLWRQGTFTEAEMTDELAKAAREKDAIEAQLAVTAEADPLPEFRPGARGGLTPRQVWDKLPMARRRAVVARVLPTITIGRLPRRGPGQPIDAGLRVVTHDGQVWEGGQVAEAAAG